MIADLPLSLVEDWVRELTPAFYADADEIANAIAAGRSFNVIHHASSYKFDIFPVAANEFRAVQMGRRRLGSAPVFDEYLDLYFATAEDTILAKLLWYRAGGCISERQWTDIRGVLAVQGERLDFGYLREWAVRVGTSDLLDEAIAEADS